MKEILLTQDSHGWAVWPATTRISLSKYKRPVDDKMYPWVDEIEEWSDDDCEIRGGESLFDFAEELLGEDFVRSPVGRSAHRFKLKILFEELPRE